MAYAYYVPLVVQSSQVTGTVTQFVALLDHTFASWKSVGNGGRIQNTDGANPADWAVFSDSALTTPVEFETIYWDDTTGRIVAWIGVGSVATSTTVYLGYDDSAVTTYQGDAVATWSVGGFVAVYHLEALSGSTWLDALGSHNLANTNATGNTGKVRFGADFNGTTAYARKTSAVVTAPPLTFSVWINADALDGIVMQAGTYNSAIGYDGFVLIVNAGSPNVVHFYTPDNFNFSADASITGVGTGAWYHIAGVTASTSSRYAYLNGVAGSQNTVSQSPSAPNSLTVGAASHDSTVDNFFNGRIDEARVHNVARSAAWIEAEYHSQNDPAAFWVLGSEVPVGGAAAWSPYLSPWGWQ